MGSDLLGQTIFAVNIFKYSITNWEEKKPKLLSLLDFSDDDVVQSKLPQHTDYYSNQGRPPYFKQWCEILEEDLNNIFQQSDVISPLLKNSTDTSKWQLWSQRYNNQQYHSCHNHGVGNLSCVLYLQFDKSVHSPTWFHSPFNDPFTGYNQEYVPQVDEGDIFLFPAMLLHESPQNTSNVPRTIMSFNIPIG